MEQLEHFCPFVRSLVRNKNLIIYMWACLPSKSSESLRDVLLRKNMFSFGHSVGLLVTCQWPWTADPLGPYRPTP